MDRKEPAVAARYKLAPYRTDSRLLTTSQVTFLPTSKSHDTKTRPNIKNMAEQALGTVP